MNMNWALADKECLESKNEDVRDILLLVCLCLVTFFVASIYRGRVSPSKTGIKTLWPVAPIFNYPIVKAVPVRLDYEEEDLLLTTKKEPEKDAVAPLATVGMDNAEKPIPLKKTIRVRRSPVNSKEAAVPQEEGDSPAFASQKPAPSIFEKIRTDKARSYVQTSFKNGELAWGARNVSPMYGIEVWVTHEGDTTETYYLPSIMVDGIRATMDGQVLAPGLTIYGYVEYPYIRRKTDVVMTLKCAGKKEIKERLKIPW